MRPAMTTGKVGFGGVVGVLVVLLAVPAWACTVNMEGDLGFRDYDPGDPPGVVCNTSKLTGSTINVGSEPQVCVEASGLCINDYQVSATAPTTDPCGYNVPPPSTAKTDSDLATTPANKYVMHHALHVAPYTGADTCHAGPVLPNLGSADGLFTAGPLTGGIGVAPSGGTKTGGWSATPENRIALPQKDGVYTFCVGSAIAGPIGNSSLETGWYDNNHPTFTITGGLLP